jgi:P-type E1-E2 ATPase
VEALLRAGRLRAVVLDRTSTLARGAAAVTDFAVRPGGDSIELLRLAAAAEAGVDHPIARALVRHAADIDLPLPDAHDVHVTPGRGVRARVDGRDVVVGSPALLAALGIDVGPLAQAADELGSRGRTPVLVAVDRAAVAVAGVADSARESTRRALGRLELRGIDLYVAGGDAVPALKWHARALGLEAAAVRGDLAPEGKRELVGKVRATGATAMVAGTAADAPALAAADLGVAVDVSPAALAAAAAILVRPDPSALAELVEAGYATRLAAGAAAGIGLGGNALGLLLAIAGAVGPLGAAGIALATSALALGAAAALSLRAGAFEARAR